MSTIILRGEYVVPVSGSFYSEHYRYGVWHDDDLVYGGKMFKCNDEAHASKSADSAYRRLSEANPGRRVRILHTEHKCTRDSDDEKTGR